MDELGRQWPAWAEEAVILYATGKTGEATAILNRRILENTEQQDSLAWLLLFDLYEANGHRETFEDLAMDYAVRFERSPPPWTPRQANAKATGDKVIAYAFGAQFTPVDKARLEHFLLEAQAATRAQLDFSQTPAPSGAFAKAILLAMDRLRELAKPVEVVGGPAFAVRLHMACQGDRMDQSGWLVLLSLLALSNDLAGYEEAALAYAVRFEISPPSFTPPIPLPEVTAADPGPSRDRDIFVLEGCVDTKSAKRLDQLASFGRGKARLTLDMGQVTRVDFASTGLLLDALIKLKSGGTQLSIINLSLPVLALLQMIGADQFASLLPRTRK